MQSSLKPVVSTDLSTKTKVLTETKNGINVFFSAMTLVISGIEWHKWS